MSLSTKINQNDFKIAVEQFIKHYQNIAAEFDNIV